jgi:hypothetical protein
MLYHLSYAAVVNESVGTIATRGPFCQSPQWSLRCS